MLDAYVSRTLGLTGRLTRGAIECWQLERLREIVTYARENSAFYRERLPAGEIDSFAGFAMLPFTAPEDLRARGAELLCVRPNEVERVVTLYSSGSTGRPKRIFATVADQELTVEYFKYGMSDYVGTGDLVLSVLPGDSPGSLNDLLRRGLEGMGARLLVFGYPGDDDLPRLTDTMLSRGVSSLVGPVSAVARAAEYSAAAGLSGALAGRIKSVLLSAEHVPGQRRELIAHTWRCRVNEQYSMTETGYTGPVSCAVPGGYHIWEAGLYYEIIDPDSGKSVPEGGYGEIVVTTLLRRAMPLIRYRTGDRSRFVPGLCACGSVLRRLERVGARAQDKKFAPRRGLPEGWIPAAKV